MPSLGSHLGRSSDIASRLGDRAVDRYRGSFYLGATAPDIRVMLRIERQQTHFFDLDEFLPQDSVARMLAVQPHLAEAARLDDQTRAFVAGYLTHLLMDEQYIQTMYRDLFGERSPLGGDLRANILDRALQYEMNRRELADATMMNDVRAALAQAAAPGNLGFLTAEWLTDWIDVAAQIAAQPPTLERLPQMISRHMERAGYTPEQVEETLRDGDALLAEAMTYASEPRVARYLSDVVDIATTRVRAYLEGTP